MAGAILGWRLDDADRTALLAQFPPRYPEAVADHITHGRAGEAPPLPEVTSSTIVGRADDGSGIEALVVAIGGSPARWDGSHYHITWSLGDGCAARESNDVISSRGWQPVGDGPAVRLIPAHWP